MVAEVFYSTVYGSTQQYAEALAERLSTEANEVPEPGRVDAADGAPLIVLSPIHGPVHHGANFVKGLSEDVVDKRPIALVTVGMMLDDVAVAVDPAKTALENRAESVKRFYLPGRMNYSELAPEHHRIMEGRISALKEKSEKTANDEMMIDAFGRDVDRVDLSRLDSIIEWVDGL